MHKLVEIIEVNAILTLESLTLVYFYTKYISNRKDYLLNEQFEDYLYSLNATKPTDLLSKQNNLTSNEQFFYVEICTLDVMDFLSCFESSGELRLERVQILELLSNLGILDDGTRMLEVDNIIAQFIVDSATSELNGAKINVDESMLIKGNLEVIDSLIKIYSLTSEETGDAFIPLHNVQDQDETSQNIFGRFSGNKNGIVFKIIRTLIVSFLNDDKYGFDKTLSAEIRHGFFSNLIRASLLDRHLITESNDNNEYQENIYWRNKYHYVTDSIWKNVDSYLKGFSKEVSQLLSEAEEWMQIKKMQTQEKRVFDYDSIDSEIFFKVKSLLESRKDSNEISQFIMGNLWELTEKFLSIMRDKLNEEFRMRLDALFDKLTVDINKAKRGAAMQELMSAILQTKSDVHEDITKAAEWFRRANSSGMQDHTLDQLIEIAINAFKEVNGTRAEIVNSVPNSFESINVPGVSIKPFVISLINLFDNAYRRSGLGDSTKVEVLGDIKSNIAYIKVQNDLSPEKYDFLVNSMPEIEEKINAGNSISLMKTEGGSGLVKVINHMIFISEQSKVSVSYDKLNFLVEIKYVF